MQLKWGTKYTFPVNGVDLASRTQYVEYDGRPARYVTRVRVAGWLEADTQSDLSNLEATLRTALKYDRQDLKFLSDANATMAASLINSDSISGVRVVDGPNFPGDTGAEYATVRRFDFEVQAEFLVPGTEKAILAWNETISVIGTGGPVKRFRVPINANFLVRQVISPRSIVRATQRGQAIGHTAPPVPPPPRWPDYELVDQRQAADRSTPKRLGRGFVEYPVSWGYVFEADVPLVALPSLPPLI
jgi:hypothetical protein